MMTRNFFYTALVLIVCTSTAKSQGVLEVQFNRAMIMYESGEYFDAVTEFKRLLFFDKKKKYAYSVNMLIGNCYKEGARFSDAIIYYTYAEMASKTDSGIFLARINIARANILRRTTKRAFTILKNLSSDPRFSKRSNEINYWRGWAFIFSDEWENAAEAFSKTDSNSALVNLCLKVHKEKFSPLFAEILSHLLPGSGQFYTGHFFSGVLSLGWNVLWGYVTINAFSANRIFDGFMVGNLLWFRFYRGNYENAEKFAEAKNLSITNRALHFLQYGFKGLKP